MPKCLFADTQEVRNVIIPVHLTTTIKNSMTATIEELEERLEDQNIDEKDMRHDHLDVLTIQAKDLEEEMRGLRQATRGLRQETESLQEVVKGLQNDVDKLWSWLCPFLPFDHPMWTRYLYICQKLFLEYLMLMSPPKSSQHFKTICYDSRPAGVTAMLSTRTKWNYTRELSQWIEETVLASEGTMMREYSRLWSCVTSHSDAWRCFPRDLLRNFMQLIQAQQKTRKRMELKHPSEWWVQLDLLLAWLQQWLHEGYNKQLGKANSADEELIMEQDEDRFENWCWRIER